MLADEQIDVVGNDSVIEKPTSVRENIEAALTDIKERTSETDKTETAKPVEKTVVSKNDTVEPVVTQAVEKPIPPPQSVPKEKYKSWETLPKEWQEFYIKRDEDAFKQISKHDEERVFGKQIKEAVAPYEALIRAEGSTPVAAVKYLLNSAYILRRGSPQQKAQVLYETAQQYGVDLSQIQNAPQVPQHVQALQNEVHQLKTMLQQREAFEKQQEQSSINEQIDTFAADTEAHPHFEAVKAHMGALLTNGLATSMQDAYDQAVYARPDIRATLLESQRMVSSDTQRVAEAKAKADAARKAGSSVKGAPGMTAPKVANTQNRSTREHLLAAFKEHGVSL